MSAPLRCPSPRCAWLFGWGTGYRIVTRDGAVSEVPPGVLVLRCPSCNQCVLVAPDTAGGSAAA